MLSLQKATSNGTSLEYDFSSPNIALSSSTVFVSLANNVNSENNECKTKIASENIDKGKSILGAPPKVEKKETRNFRNKKVKNIKSQQKKPHFCHHYGASRHTRPNCYKCLATKQSNNMISSGNHNQFPSPESVSILFCSSWRSSQGPHVPFELEQFQFFSLSTGSNVCSKERFFQGVEGKRFKVI